LNKSSRQPLSPDQALYLRKVNPEDAAAIHVLLAELGYQASQNLIKARIVDYAASEDCLMLVMTDALKVVGVIVVYRSSSLSSGSCAVISNLIVTRSMRGMGLGRQLVDAAISWTQKNNLSTLRVGSQTYREGAHDFYRSLGFTQYKTQHWFEYLL